MTFVYGSMATINYGYLDSKVVATIDQEIVRYYCALIPKWIDWQPQKYAAHITVVRELKEKIDQSKLGLWGKHEGLKVKFYYSPIIHQDERYFWLNCYSKQLEKIRLELGLSRYRMFGAFHISIANKKFKY